MTRMQTALAAWGGPDFEDELKTAIGQLDAADLPLQAGLAAGSHALEMPLDIMLIHASETAGVIEAKVGIFYRSLMPGCACAGDPTVEDEQNEYCTVLARIDKQTAETTFKLLDE